MLGATITGGTLAAVNNIGTITSILGATITGGTLSAVGNLLNGTITSVLGATITGGTLAAVNNIGTITSILGATITAGTLSSVTSISQKSFVESSILNVQSSSTTFAPLPAVTTSVLGVYSYFVYNRQGGSIVTRVEISADGTNYFVDTNGATIAAGAADVVVPARFLKYTRLSYRLALLAAPATIDVFFNGQGT
ncbi:DUF6385 domain-containing protein [Paenibacillus sp. SC116]|nr:DUF6385 domain-containing protein [Paenibacillus sp. SC116]